MIIAVYSTLFIVIGALLLTIAFRLERALRRFRMPQTNTRTIELPSVSVCIPARNETHAMTQCLERVLASDYRKMEIVVFDDESADNTSALINSFAHEGVRFVPGTDLPQGWLGKNHALEVLARESSGTYIIFLDVDTHIQPTTISQLVDYMMSEQLQMTAVIPGRNDIWRSNVLFGHLRYYWKLILSRDTSPATSSALWMIRRRTFLNTIGGFVSHKAEVEPEQHLAAIIGSKAYHCLVNNQQLGVSYEKKWKSQCETSRRLLYPMIGGTWQMGLLGLMLFALLNVPLLLVISGLVFDWTLYHTIALVFVVLFGLVYARYTYIIWLRNWWMSIIIWPIVMLQELVLYVYSIVGYATNTVTWKGRPVASPATIKKHSFGIK